MPRIKKVMKTDVPFGQKFNDVMAAKGMAGDYAKLAEDFGVTTPSAREWVKYGRFAKERYPDLVKWSGRSLDWWFDAVPPLGLGAASSVQQVTPIYDVPPPPAWPFRTVSVDQFWLLDDWGRAEVEGFIKGLLHNNNRGSKAA